ncbi:S-adenosyl-L-methionine-dependent methyltransferase [Penicillium chermesinum]|uniref:S-adenosyl-L-methionine-dependent methyltransferase n=1 Tax=Penicillium chermesinum TaxID=63820 RepID=A0A9W9NSA9_9EURO|nr:S-adenosyl-L-methionine-dependent methyltransferase [Penicillium chermesinum]KAJ5224998.1 S-adenosyl-L-methionine-dependent methyltransferase [Penicillium chermesinum]
MTIETTSQRSLPRTGLAALLPQLDIPGSIQLPDGTIVKVGAGEPIYRVIFRSARALRTPMTELSIGRAYLTGEIDFVYDYLRDATKMNAKAIGEHYSRSDDFYLTFIDKRYRMYSQGLFKSQDESIEDASEHKMETMFSSLGLTPGMRILDIGGGWGGVTQYCGARGVHVTTLTLTADSARFIQSLITEGNLPGEVFLQDFFNHKPQKPYDHIVIFGPCLGTPGPGGKMYLDGSAAVTKYSPSAFTREYIWGGTHTFFTLQDVIRELLYHGFEIVDVARETTDYQLTMLEWAKRLDAAKETIIAGWGEETYRLFRLFLWAERMHSSRIVYRRIISSPNGRLLKGLAHLRCVECYKS